MKILKVWLRSGNSKLKNCFPTITNDLTQVMRIYVYRNKYKSLPQLYDAYSSTGRKYYTTGLFIVNIYKNKKKGLLYEDNLTPFLILAN